MIHWGFHRWLFLFWLFLILKTSQCLLICVIQYLCALISTAIRDLVNTQTCYGSSFCPPQITVDLSSLLGYDFEIGHEIEISRLKYFCPHFVMGVWSLSQHCAWCLMSSFEKLSTWRIFSVWTLSWLNIHSWKSPMVKMIAFVWTVLSAFSIATRADCPILPLVRFQKCYEGDTCTKTAGEKVRFASVSMLLTSRNPIVWGQPRRAHCLWQHLVRMICWPLENLGFSLLGGLRRITTDRYGRTVAELFTETRNVAEQQVMNGHAVISYRHVLASNWISAWCASSLDQGCKRYGINFVTVS